MQAKVSEKIPEALFEAIQIELLRAPAGLKEYDLLQNLRAYGFFSVETGKARTTAEIFENHFVLYHALYRLRERLAQAGEGWIDIHVLQIQLMPPRRGGRALIPRDTMRDYYLDWGNLAGTTQADIDSMLNTFWQNYVRYSSRSDALAALGLQDPVDDNKIKRTYRRLVMQCHPDRGGSTQRLQELNAAINLLRTA